MLRVTIELVPGGDEDRAHVIEQMTIANVSNLADVSDYDIAMTDGGQRYYGTVHDHVRAHGAWELVDRALNVTMLSEPRTETQKLLGERLA